MNVDEFLETVERILVSRQLSLVERFILRQSWNGQTYSDMARDSAYGSPHLKEIGSQLWQELSEALGERVTKKNLHLVLNQYQQNRTGKQQRMQQELPTDTVAEAIFPGLVTTALEFPDRPVPLNSPLYIERPPIEELAYAEISQPGCVVRIKAPRMMGKSSLLLRLLAKASSSGYKTVNLDFQEADEAVFASLDKFLRWFCANISRQLHLNPRLDDYWDEDMGSKVSCKIYFEAYLLEQIDSPLLLALNEVNRVFEHPSIAQDFLPMLRAWHEQARANQSWQKLRLAVVHSTEIYIPLKLNQSPFNVGLSIRLPQFTGEQVQDLARRYGLDWTDTNETQQLMAIVGGHPYLVNIALYHLCRKDMTLDELLLSSPTEAGIYNHHLRGHLAMLLSEPVLATALRQVVMAQESVQLEAIAQSTLPSAIAAYKLESMGLIQLEGNLARVSCQLYRLYFREQLTKENSIEARLAQLEKEKQDYQRLGNLDELTQIANRRYFNQYLETQWQQYAAKIPVLSLILCDVDNFKFYNDTHGTIAGDACLQRIAGTIRECVVRQDSVVARYGGEEFAVLLPQTDTKAAVETAQTIRQRVKALGITHTYPGVSGFPAEVLTVSLGVASATPVPQTSPDMLIAAADQALLQSKRQGRDRVTVSEQ